MLFSKWKFSIVFFSVCILQNSIRKNFLSLIDLMKIILITNDSKLSFIFYCHYFTDLTNVIYLKLSFLLVLSTPLNYFL